MRGALGLHERAMAERENTRGLPIALRIAVHAGEPEQVAQDVLSAIDRGTPVVYTPAAWRWVMLVIRNLPRFVMRRLNV